MKISMKATKVIALWIIKQNIKQKNKHSFFVGNYKVMYIKRYTILVSIYS